MNHIGRGSRIRTYEVTESESVALPLGDTPIKLPVARLGAIEKWQGWQDLNLRLRKSKSRALPLGDTPKS